MATVTTSPERLIAPSINDDVLTDLLTLTQPMPAEDLFYTWVDDPNDERPGSAAPTRRGRLKNLEHLRTLMRGMRPDSFLILEPKAGGDWWAQTWCDPDGWVVESASVTASGNVVRTYRTDPGVLFSLFPFATAYGMLCEILLRREPAGWDFRVQVY